MSRRLSAAASWPHRTSTGANSICRASCAMLSRRKRGMTIDYQSVKQMGQGKNGKRRQLGLNWEARKYKLPAQILGTRNCNLNRAQWQVSTLPLSVFAQ